MNHTGSCFCGAVEVRSPGSPEGMGYCHCQFVPIVVGRPRQRLQPVEAGGGADHVGSAARRDVREDGR